VFYTLLTIFSCFCNKITNFHFGFSTHFCLLKIVFLGFECAACFLIFRYWLGCCRLLYAKW
jgi:hypothetical protein